MMDRRTRRTRDALQNALLDLLRTQSYNAVTVQAIAEHADVGRTTFYLHFNDKVDLFLHWHAAHVPRLGTITRAALLGDEVPPATVALYEFHWQHRAILRDVYLSQDGEVIMRHLREHIRQELAHLLNELIGADGGTIPVDLLAEYLAGAQMQLVVAWIAKHLPYTPQQLAATIHHLQRAALREALGQ